MNLINTKMESLYTYLDDSAAYLEKAQNLTYLEGLAEAGENLFREEVCQNVTMEQKNWLLDKLDSLNLEELSNEDIRKAFQLAVLKGMKGAVQPHHSMTPDTVCLFLSYLVNKVIGKREESIHLLDMAAGSGNLVHALMNQVTAPLSVTAFEVDETLVKLAFVSANLQKHELQLFHKDSIEPISYNPVDVVVTDLPVGYYPKDEIAAEYALRAKEGHSFIHHLMIEQAINKTKDGGFLFFLVPNFIFESDQAKQLHEFVKGETNILALLQLPKTMFQSEQFGKSIFVLQKKGENTIQPKQALLAELPSFSKKEALSDMMKQINKWFKDELRIE
ncbi:adenine-specific methyltransferase [Halalkalibacter wakoensis JCM 9140]|uniref:Adenine-specific methyltransferase n=1 Tax=Halalkalibacter wakoensis JCM 9140 TaxID=1236970 RepID=W4Q285_9BACI|nr:class I SAM-dependent methyltransferase [Halalkalibacter wakoensis]GAE25843.1 adenine-specific methyltransferase [Halalkalibacter wakoensis JCM 9140]